MIYGKKFRYQVDLHFDRSSASKQMKRSKVVKTYSMAQAMDKVERLLMDNGSIGWGKLPRSATVYRLSWPAKKKGAASSKPN